MNVSFQSSRTFSSFHFGLKCLTRGSPSCLIWRYLRSIEISLRSLPTRICPRDLGAGAPKEVHTFGQLFARSRVKLEGMFYLTVYSIFISFDSGNTQMDHEVPGSGSRINLMVQWIENASINCTILIKSL